MVPVRYNLRSLLERRATSLMTVRSLGMVAMIFVILFGFIAPAEVKLRANCHSGLARTTVRANQRFGATTKTFETVFATMAKTPIRCRWC